MMHLIQKFELKIFEIKNDDIMQLQQDRRHPRPSETTTQHLSLANSKVEIKKEDLGSWRESSLIKTIDSLHSADSINFKKFTQIFRGRIKLPFSTMTNFINTNKRARNSSRISRIFSDRFLRNRSNQIPKDL